MRIKEITVRSREVVATLTKKVGKLEKYTPGETLF
jgi:hypothetical protein